MTEQGDKAQSLVDRRMVDFIREHGTRVERWLRRFGVPESDVSDARQDVWVTAYRHLPALGDTPMQRGFLYTVCRRTARDLRRRAYRRYERASVVDATTSAASAFGTHAEAWFEARAKLRAVQELTTHELADVQRDILLACSLGADSPETLAVRHDCPTKTVFSRLYAAREHLRRQLMRDGWLMGLLDPRRGPWVSPAPTPLALVLSCLVVVATLHVVREPVSAPSLIGTESAPSESRRVGYLTAFVPPPATVHARRRLSAEAAPQPPTPASMHFSVFEVVAPTASLALHQVELFAFEPVVVASSNAAPVTPQRVHRVTHPADLKPRLSRPFAPHSALSRDAWAAAVPPPSP